MGDSYLIRDVPGDLREQALDKARRQGRTLRWVLLQALQGYVNGEWEPPVEGYPATKIQKRKG